MPKPTSERQALKRERDELPGQIAAHQAELATTPATNKARRERLEWQIRERERRLAEVRKRLSDLAPAEENHLLNRPTIGVFGVLVIVSTLAGCSTGQMIVFQKPGVAASQQKADEVACIEASIGSVEDPRPSPLPPIDRQAFERCMRAKGYVPVTK
jgi:hypothetical protein